MGYEIQLSFLPVHESLTRFRVFRRERLPDEKSFADDVHSFWLRKTHESERTDTNYWVSFVEHDGFQPHQVDPFENMALTKRWLLEALDLKCRTVLGANAYCGISQGMRREVAIKVAEHPQGQEQILLQPYFLEAKGRFGLLVDFRFDLADDVSFSREVLRLSLSLDDHNRRNANFYADKRTKIERFLQQRFQELSSLRFAEGTAELVRSFETLSTRL